uniref:Uncharacterized protein n=1 Tax=Pristionchus pacificus TaxID=54126 RepID=A0A2A6C413_PRIPA|eukprot:PDM72870.1 hypothetical protein PRIPAC_39304 [Pristionchus pacificus]
MIVNVSGNVSIEETPKGKEKGDWRDCKGKTLPNEGRERMAQRATDDSNNRGTTSNRIWNERRLRRSNEENMCVPKREEMYDEEGRRRGGGNSLT